MQHLPGTQPPGAATGPTSTATGQTPYGLGIGIGPSVPPPPREDKRRRTRTRSDEGDDVDVAERERAARDANHEASVARTQNEVDPTLENGKAPDGAAEPDLGSKNESSSLKRPAPESEEPPMDVDAEAQDESEDATPALRRSNRRPAAGTSLASAHRQTRPSPSPTPSTTSSTSSARYRPILPDLDLAHNVFARHAAQDWCTALAAGGGTTVQGPGVNPASAGQVMMGGTGGMQREGEVVADFLYAIKVKGELARCVK